MKRTPIGRKTGLERRRVVKRRRPWRAGVAGDAEKREAFYAIGSQRCVREHEFAAGHCDGPLDPHHVIAKAAIKSYAKSEHLDGRSLASLLWDPSNRIVLCRRHHQLHEGAHDRVPRRLLPAAAIAFAFAVGLEHHIDRYYPTIKETDDAA